MESYFYYFFGFITCAIVIILPAAKLVRQLSAEEKQKLISLMQKEKSFSVEEPVLIYFANEKILAKDWLSPEEDEAWQDL